MGTHVVKTNTVINPITEIRMKPQNIEDRSVIHYKYKQVKKGKTPRYEKTTLEIRNQPDWAPKPNINKFCISSVSDFINKNETYFKHLNQKEINLTPIGR